MVEHVVGKKYAPHNELNWSRECLFILPNGDAVMGNCGKNKPHIREKELFDHYVEIIEPRKSNIGYIGVYENPVNKADIQIGGFIYLDKLSIGHKLFTNNKNYDLIDTMEIQYVENVETK